MAVKTKMIVKGAALGAMKTSALSVKVGDLVQSGIDVDAPIYLILDTNATFCRPYNDMPTAGWKVLTPNGTIDIIGFHIVDWYKKVAP